LCEWQLAWQPFELIVYSFHLVRPAFPHRAFRLFCLPVFVLVPWLFSIAPFACSTVVASFSYCPFCYRAFPRAYFRAFYTALCSASLLAFAAAFVALLRLIIMQGYLKKSWRTVDDYWPWQCFFLPIALPPFAYCFLYCSFLDSRFLPTESLFC